MFLTLPVGPFINPSQKAVVFPEQRGVSYDVATWISLLWARAPAFGPGDEARLLLSRPTRLKKKKPGWEKFLSPLERARTTPSAQVAQPAPIPWKGDGDRSPPLRQIRGRGHALTFSLTFDPPPPSNRRRRRRSIPLFFTLTMLLEQPQQQQQARSAVIKGESLLGPYIRLRLEKVVTVYLR